MTEHVLLELIVPSVNGRYGGLPTGHAKRQPAVADKGSIAAGRLCLSRGDDPDLGGQLAVDEARARRGGAAGLCAAPIDREPCPDRAGVGRRKAAVIAGAR